MPKGRRSRPPRASWSLASDAGRRPRWPPPPRSRAQADPQVVRQLIQRSTAWQRRLHPGGLSVRAGRQPTVGQQQAEIVRGIMNASEQLVQLGERQPLGRRGGDQIAVDGDGVGLRVDLDAGQGIVVDHLGLADLAGRADRHQLPAQAELVGQARLQRGRCDVGLGSVRAARSRKSAGRIRTGCGVGIEAFGSPRAPTTMPPPLITTLGLTPKNFGSQSTRSASLPTSTEPI